MRGAGTSSDAMVFSLSELAFLLLSVAITAAVLLAGAWERARAEAAAAQAETVRLRGEVMRLETEVAELTADLERLLGGVVACYRRPGSPLPPVAAEITIDSRFKYSVQPTGGTPVLIETDPASAGSDLTAALRTAVAEDQRYAAANSCYLRVVVHNRTGSYPLYQGVEEVVRALGMVVVPE